jgi:hypothetical protein
MTNKTDDLATSERYIIDALAQLGEMRTITAERCKLHSKERDDASRDMAYKMRIVAGGLNKILVDIKRADAE